MGPIPVTRTIAKPDLDGCPVGFLFRGKNADWSREEEFFADMEAPLNHRRWSPETYLYLIDDDEGKALENVAKSETTIITMDRSLTDCRVEAKVRQFIPGAWPNMDDEYCRVARNGVILRMLDFRRYYQFCLEGYDRAVLYRRCDCDRVALAEKRFPLDPRRYHHLLAEVQGERIRCWLDGELVADIRDSEYACGAAGIRTNSICRFQGIRVATWEEGHRVYQQRLGEENRQRQEFRESLPQPVLWRRYDLPRLKGGRPHFYRPREDGPVRLLIAGNGEDFKGYSLFDLEGDLLWESPAQGEGPGGEFKFADMDGDGVKEIVSFFDGGIAVHSSVDGRQLAQAPWPQAGPFDRSQERAYITHLYLADLGGTGHCDSVVLKDDGSAGGWTFQVLGAELQSRWTQTLQLPPMGHHINVHDVDGDGRDEILAGYHCYDGDGELVWRVEAARYWDVVHGARHPDAVVVGELWPGAMRAAYAAGGEGFVLVDATCGAVIARHPIGHAQGISAGKFAREVPGHQILIGTRHQNYGILCFFDGEGTPIGRFQPDYLSQGGPPVNWTGDGAEFVLLTSSPPVFGLWDRYGRFALDLRELDLFVDLPLEQRTAAVSLPVDISGDARDELALQRGSELFVYTQDRPVAGERIFAPQRDERIMHPRSSVECWAESG